MSKHDEFILAVKRDELFENETLTFQGVLTDRTIMRRLMQKFSRYLEVRRGPAETDPTLKQMIPYVVVRSGDSVFVYKRLKAGGEKRLHDQLSIGVGGHMNRINDIHDWDRNLIFNMHRELAEELNIKGEVHIEPEIIGLVNDDENEVGLHHICILMVVDLPKGTDVEVRETDKLEGYWIRIKDLKKTPLYENLETWSQMAADIL